MNNNFVTLEIEDRKYALLPMPPVKAVRFVPKVIKALTGGVEGSLDEAIRSTNQAELGSVALKMLSKIDVDLLVDLGMEALDSDVHAGPKKLSNKAHFDSWFRDHKGDMIPVMVWAIWEHSKDFLLESKGGFQAVLGDLSLFQKAGTQSTSSEES